MLLIPISFATAWGQILSDGDVDHLITSRQPDQWTPSGRWSFQNFAAETEAEQLSIVLTHSFDPDLPGKSLKMDIDLGQPNIWLSPRL